MANRLIDIGADFELEISCDYTGDQHDNSSQTDNNVPDVKESCTLGTQSHPMQKYTIEDFRCDPKGLQYYTGLDDYLAFFDVLASLGPASYKLKYWNNVNPSISVPDQFLLTTVRLG